MSIELINWESVFIPGNNHENSRYLVCSEGKLYAPENTAWLDQLPALLQCEHVIGMTRMKDRLWVLVIIKPEHIPVGWHEVSLRHWLQLDDAYFLQLGRAAQLSRWYQHNQFCGCCGGAAKLAQHEWMMQCRDCGHQKFPVISPCIIVLVYKDDELLLARHHRHADSGMYSLLAGFIEAGESAEQTIVREVKEEAGIKVKRPVYFGSQAWPFPGQLMLGYTVEYESGDLVPQVDEIADLGWFSPKFLPVVPGEFSIAGRLISAFINNRSVIRST